MKQSGSSRKAYTQKRGAKGMKNRKTVIVGLLVVLFLVLAAWNYAYADFTSIFTVGNSGSTAPKSVFTLDETPWLYLKLPGTGYNVTPSVWSDPDANPFSVVGIGLGDQYWFSLDSGLDQGNNPVTWDSIKQAGLWDISASYVYPFNSQDPYAGAGSTSFTVNAVPEPASSALFLLGCVPLAVRKLRGE